MKITKIAKEILKIAGKKEFIKQGMRVKKVLDSLDNQEAQEELFNLQQQLINETNPGSFG